MSRTIFHQRSLFYHLRLLFDRFQRQLNFALQLRHLGAQCRQFGFLAPRSLHHVLQGGNIFGQFLVLLLEVLKNCFDGRKGVQEVERSQTRICGNVTVIVGVEVVGFAARIETVLRKVESVLLGRFALYEQVESVEASDGLQLTARSGRRGDMVQLLADELRVGGFEAVEFHGIAVRAVAVQLHSGFEMFQVRAYALDFGVVILHG